MLITLLEVQGNQSVTKLNTSKYTPFYKVCKVNPKFKMVLRCYIAINMGASPFTEPYFSMVWYLAVLHTM